MHPTIGSWWVTSHFLKLHQLSDHIGTCFTSKSWRFVVLELLMWRYHKGFRMTDGLFLHRGWVCSEHVSRFDDGKWSLHTKNFGEPRDCKCWLFIVANSFKLFIDFPSAEKTYTIPYILLMHTGKYDSLIRILVLLSGMWSNHPKGLQKYHHVQWNVLADRSFWSSYRPCTFF